MNMHPWLVEETGQLFVGEGCEYQVKWIEGRYESMERKIRAG